jgi:hypothetical protein
MQDHNLNTALSMILHLLFSPYTCIIKMQWGHLV